jgi:hypothetical protein
MLTQRQHLHRRLHNQQTAHRIDDEVHNGVEMIIAIIVMIEISDAFPIAEMCHQVVDHAVVVVLAVAAATETMDRRQQQYRLSQIAILAILATPMLSPSYVDQHHVVIIQDT